MAQIEGDSPNREAGPAVKGEGAGGAMGVSGYSGQGTGVQGMSKNGYGLVGVSFHGPAAIHGVAENKDEVAAGLFDGNVGVKGVLNVTGQTNLGADAGVQGDLKVNGDIFTFGDVQLLGVGKDLAEPFTVDGMQGGCAGSVVVLTGPDRVQLCDQPYDRRVAGIVSGAGNLRPGIVLGRQDTDDDRPVVALTGTVWCQVDADQSPIELGDLLTTSATPGHAMRASDSSRSFGSVIGKALAGLETGRGLIPVLVALH